MRQEIKQKTFVCHISTGLANYSGTALGFNNFIDMIEGADDIV